MLALLLIVGCLPEEETTTPVPPAYVAEGEVAGPPVRGIGTDGELAAFRAPDGESDGDAAGLLPDDEEELVLALHLRRTLLTPALLAYRRGDRLLLPLQELALLLELPILVGDEGATAEGWLIREDRRFRLDVGAGVATADGHTVALPPGSTTAIERELYVDSRILARLLPLDLAYEPARSLVRIEPREALPVDERAARLAQQSRLRRAVGADDPDLVRLEVPYSPLDWPMVDVNLDLSYRTEDGGPGADYDVLATGDLLWMSGRLFVAGDREGDLHSFRLNLARHDPDRDLLGPLHASLVELGDVDIPGQALTTKAADGRGLVVGNLPLGFVAELDRVTLQGDLRPGYDAELYRNGVLIDSARPSEDNRYEFRDIALVLGQNALTVVIHGPQGQRSEETQYFHVGPGLIQAGELRYRATLLQLDETLLGLERDRHAADDQGVGEALALLELEYGLWPGTSIAGTLAEVPLRDGDSSSILGIGLRQDLGRLYATLDLTATADGGVAGRLGAQTAIGPVSLSASHSEYRHGYRSRRNDARGSDAPIVSESELRAITGLRGRNPAGLDSLELSGRQQTRDDGRHSIDVGPRLSGRLARVNYSNRLAYRHDGGDGRDDDDQLSGSLQLSGAIAPFRLRGQLDYELGPNPGLDSLGLSLVYPFDKDTILNLTIDRNLDRDRDRGTEYRARLSRGFERLRLSLFAAYDDAESSAFVGLGLGFSLMRDPHSGRPEFSSRRLARSGGLAPRVFVDGNLNGELDPGEPPVEGVEFAQGARHRPTDTEGRTVLVGLAADRPMALRPRLGSIGEPGWEPAEPGYRVVPRPGKLARIDVPIVPTGLVEGVVALERDGVATPAGNVIVQLVREAEDAAVAAEVRSEFDGYYVIERIRPGRYRLRVDPDQARRLALEPPPDVEVAVTIAGEELSGVDLTLRRRP